MKVSAIEQDLMHSNQRRNLFIQFANSFMSAPQVKDPTEKALLSNPNIKVEKPVKLGIENLQEFTIFPKEVKDGRTIITA